MAELEAARPRPKSTSFSPVLKRDQEARVKDIFLWLPCVVSAKQEKNKNRQGAITCKHAQVSHTHSCIFTISVQVGQDSGLMSKYVILQSCCFFF